MILAYPVAASFVSEGALLFGTFFVSHWFSLLCLTVATYFFVLSS